MAITRRDLQLTYSAKTTDELEWLYKHGHLTKLAFTVLEEELSKRGSAFKKRRGPREFRIRQVTHGHGRMTINDKVSVTLLLVSCLTPLWAAIFGSFAKPPFNMGYKPTPIFAVIILVNTVLLGGYFVATDLYNWLNKRTLVQNSAIYHDKVGAFTFSTFYWPFAPKMARSYTGGAVLLALAMSLHIALAWLVAHFGIASILAAFGFQSFIAAQ